MSIGHKAIGSEPTISRRRLLGLTCTGVLAAGLAPALAACGPAAEVTADAVTNPAAGDWLSKLAEDVAASVIANTLENAFKGIFRNWGKATSYQVSKACHNYQQPWYGDGIYGVAAAPALLISLRYHRGGYPLTDGLLVVTETGKTAVFLPSWAWQGLSMFIASELRGKKGDELAQSRQFYGLTLIPSKPRIKSGSSPLNTVGYVTYETALGGWVELSRQSSSSGSTVEILATGLDSSSSAETSKIFRLPTTISQT